MDMILKDMSVILSVRLLLHRVNKSGRFPIRLSFNNVVTFIVKFFRGGYASIKHLTLTYISSYVL